MIITFVIDLDYSNHSQTHIAPARYKKELKRITLPNACQRVHLWCLNKGDGR